MAKRLKIGIDMDGVVVDFISAFRQEAEILLGRKLPKESLGWNFDNWEISKREINAVWKKIKNSDNWWFYNAITLPTVVENLPWLVENHDVYFITARVSTKGFTTQKQTQMYLYDIGIQFPVVIVEYNKGPVASALRLDTFIDDKIDNLIEINKATRFIPEMDCGDGRTKLFLHTQPYNRDYKTPKSWTRVNNFKEFVDKIQEFK